MKINFIMLKTRAKGGLPFFKSSQVIQAFEIKDILYCVGNGKKEQIPESKYYTLDDDRKQPLQYILKGKLEGVAVSTVVSISYFNRYQPRIGGYFVVDEEGHPSYLTGIAFRAYFNPHVPE